MCLHLFYLSINPVKPGILNDSQKHLFFFNGTLIVPFKKILFYLEAQTEQMHAIWCYLYGQK